MKSPLETISEYSKIKNLCIYCNTNSLDLTDEHIIPSGLGGDQIAVKASCEDCSKITAKIELHVLRNYGLREARSVLNIGTRRKKEKKFDLPIKIVLDNEEEYTDYISLDNHPIVFNLPLFEKPTLLTKYKDPTGIRIRGYHIYSVRKYNLDLETKAIKRVYGRHRNYDNCFGKFLAKIAWSSWISSEYSNYDLEIKFLPEIITGLNPMVGKYVGICDYAVKGNINTPCLHAIHYSIWDHEGKNLVVAHIQFFLQINPCPTYIVCIGYLKEGTPVLAKFKNWILPKKGMIGSPLGKIIPKYLATNILGKKGMGSNDILNDIKSTGIKINP